MASANRVDTHLFQDFELPLQGPHIESRAERSQIVMIANAVDLYLLAIEKEALVYVETDRADSEDRFVSIDDHTVNGAAGLRHCGDGSIEIWVFQVPQLWVGDAHRHRTTIACTGSDGRRYWNSRRNRLAGFLPVHE